ncbi:MAG: hypothetical protein AB7N76_21720 [Planctomycetota bacterium]
MTDADPSSVAASLALSLEAAGIPCAIGGSLALGFWGVPRGTKDADLNAFVDEDRYAELLEVLIRSGCSAPGGEVWTAAARERFLREAREGDAAVVWKDGFRVDVFVPSIPFYAEAQARLRRVDTSAGALPVLSPEALTVFKLLFFRDKDLVDLRRLVARQGRALDTSYVRGALVGMVGELDERIAAWDQIVRDHAGD